MFITALFIIARTWKQPRCPSADEWIRKLWYIYTMEYYSAIKKNSFESVLMRWMKLKPIIQSEVSQKEKHQYNMEFRKMVTIILYARQKKRHRCIEQTFGLYGRRRGWDDLKEQHQNMNIIKCETDRQSRLDAWHKCSGLVHWDYPEGWHGEGGGRGDRDGEYEASNEYSGLISFRIDWFDLFVVQETLKSLPQHHIWKTSILWHSAFYMMWLSHTHMTTG